LSGWFIVIEGIDGCGSTTQVRRLATELRARGRTVVTTCEPTAGPVGALIRQALRRQLGDSSGDQRSLDWATLALLFAADRVDHNRTVIEPALAREQIVISDRYDLSSLAYQSATADSGSQALPWIRQLNSRARRPDLTVVLDVSAEVAGERRLRRGANTELFEVDELQRRLAAVYARAEELVPGDRVCHVRGEASETAILADVLRGVDEVIGMGPAIAPPCQGTSNR